MSGPSASILVGPPGASSPTDALIDEVSGLSWSDGQHGPASLSCMIPGDKYRALKPELRRGGRAWLMVNGRCRWSGFLAPVPKGLASGGLLPLSAHGTYREGANDETYCVTLSDPDTEQWFMRKGSSQRITSEMNGTLLLKAEGGNSDDGTYWKNGIKAEMLYLLDGGLGDPVSTIPRLSFHWNVDLAPDWRCYIDAWTDAWGGTMLSRVWTQKNLTDSGDVIDLACPAGTRCLSWGLISEAKNALAVDTFAELSALVVGTRDIDISDALTAIAADTIGPAAGPRFVIGSFSDPRSDLFWRPGDGSRSYCMESWAAKAAQKVDFRYTVPEKPGVDGFTVQPMPTAPTDRTHWYVVRSTDPGVVCPTETDTEDGMDVAAVYYGTKGTDSDAPAGTPTVVYSPASPSSVSDRVRPFDYREQRLTAEKAEAIADHAVAWYGSAAEEKDRKPFGDIEVSAPIATVDGAPVMPWEVTVGDWISVLDDDEHTWPQMVMNADHGEDGLTVTISLTGDGGDFNYEGRAEPPHLQKRKRKRGRHKHTSWARWNAQQKAKAKRDARRSKYESSKAYQRKLRRRRPKWGPS